MNDQDNFFSSKTIIHMAETASSQFGRVPATVHYYAVESLVTRMRVLTRVHIQCELDYWRSVLQKRYGPQAANYSAFQITHMLDALRAPLSEVARRGNVCGEQMLKRAQDVCSALCAA